MRDRYIGIVDVEVNVRTLSVCGRSASETSSNRSDIINTLLCRLSGLVVSRISAWRLCKPCRRCERNIVVNNSVGIQFNNFNAGKNVDITVTKGNSGGPVLFNNWVFTNTPFSITVDDNYDACRFINCFDKSGNIVSK